MSISRESIVLMLICLADLASTIFVVNYRHANEGNPLMKYYLDHGLATFVAAKLVLLLMPLFIAEWARQHRPQFVTRSLRVAAAAYLFAYVGGVAQLNIDRFLPYSVDTPAPVLPHRTPHPRPINMGAGWFHTGKKVLRTTDRWSVADRA